MFKIRKFTFLLLLISFSGQICEAQYLCFCQKLFEQDGTISKDFWNKKLGIVKTTLKKIVRDKNILDLINQNINEGLVNKGIRIENRSVESFKKINDRFYLCEIAEFSSDPNYAGPPGTTLYIVDLNSPMTAYPIWGSAERSAGDIKVTSVEEVGMNYFRFFLTGFPGNGRLSEAPYVQAWDMDFSKNEFSWSQGAFAEDIDGDGHKELIVGCEVTWYLNWYWVLKNVDGKWIDVSKSYPNFYKNNVVKVYSKLKKFGKYEYIRQALIHAAELGGPSAFVGK